MFFFLFNVFKELWKYCVYYYVEFVVRLKVFNFKILEYIISVIVLIEL